ncbi:MAG: hypothetical protein V1804_00980 [Patescibacteria group bacterium]
MLKNKQMKEFLKKNRIPLSIISYLAILGVLYFFSARPMVSSIEKKNNEIQERIANQEIRKEKITELPSIRKQSEMLGNQEEKLKILLSENNTVNLIEKIEKIADETGNKIKIELPEKQEDTKKASKPKKTGEKETKPISENLPSDKYTKINITLSGKYQNFISFMKKIENTEYYCDAISFKVSIDNSGSSKGNPFQDNLSSSDGSITQDKDNISSKIEAVFYLNNN